MELCSLICPSVSAALISGNISKCFEYAAVQATMDTSVCHVCLMHRHSVSATSMQCLLLN